MTIYTYIEKDGQAVRVGAESIEELQQKVAEYANVGAVPARAEDHDASVIGPLNETIDSLQKQLSEALREDEGQPGAASADPAPEKPAESEKAGDADPAQGSEGSASQA